MSSLLSLRGIQKSFGGVRALRSGSLEVSPGEVHLLMGENGAGKSTLMKITAGIERHDGGEMLFRGQRAAFGNPSAAAAQGISMVHQESLLAGHLTVAENIFLGRQSSSPFGWVQRGRLMEQARRLIADHHFPLDAAARVEKLSPAGKQLVEICRAISQESSLLIFDEPTSSLSESETREVFRMVGELKERGMGIVYITHRLDELRSVGDRVTVLRDGETVHAGALEELSRGQLIQHMVGRPLEAIYQRERGEAGEILLRAAGLGRGKIRDISFALRAGEITGLAGLMGAGRTSLCNILFGVAPARTGTIWISGRPARIGSPRDAVALGIALIPEDRQRTGLALRLPVAYNITLPGLGKVSRFGVIGKRGEGAVAEQYRQRLRIRCESTRQPAGRLSGGNQQKVVIAKWVARGARVFVFDEPTRGIDIGAKQEVFEQMDQLARGGAAVLMVSSELPELLQVADRILVMRQGRLAGELAGRTTQEEIMRLAAFEEEDGFVPERARAEGA